MEGPRKEDERKEGGNKGGREGGTTTARWQSGRGQELGSETGGQTRDSTVGLNFGSCLVFVLQCWELNPGTCTR